MTRVKLVPDLLNPKDVDVGGELVVDATHERVGRHGRREIEMRDLRERVNAGIRAARIRTTRSRAHRSRRRSRAELALHRSRVLLDLPAAVARPAYSIVSLKRILS